MKKVILNTDIQHPIGSLYFNIYNTNPHDLFGGTWERIAKGRVLVGVDEDDEDFNESQKIGGEKEHTLTIDEMPKHNHNIGAYMGEWMSSGAQIQWVGSGQGYRAIDNPVQGNNQSHNNLQPYFTCYIWVRVS